MKKAHNLQVVVVGGGFGGVKTALELANKSGIEVTLISQGTNFEYHGALYRTATGRSPMEVVIPLRDIFSRAKNVHIVLDSIEKINPGKKTLISSTGNTYRYDKVVFAMGNVPNYFGIAGMRENALCMTTISNTMILRRRITTLLNSPKKTPKIVVIGGGASGVELAAELPHFADMAAKRYGYTPKKLNITLIEGAERVLPQLLPKASAKTEKQLQRLGIKLLLNTLVQSCQPGKVCLDQQDLEADLIVWTAGSRAVDFYHEQPEVFELERGKVRVDGFLHAKGQRDLYVIGDNAATPFSGMAQTAIHDARFVARNIIRHKKKQRQRIYRSFHPIYVITVGPKWAVVQTGKGVISGYRGWLVRRRADLQIFKNFEPYKKAIKTWRKGNKVAKF